MKRLLTSGLLAFVLAVTVGVTNVARADESPVVGGGNFGIGLDFGQPGSWGATGKVWIDNKNAFQGAVKFDGNTILQLDYLWHDFDLIHVKHGALPFYVGVGGDLSLNSGSAAIAARVPVGITYLFQREDVPVDIFVEAVPTIWFYSGGAQFDVLGDLGARYYF
jgi:hypothetical protein